ncbi:hypothetical protein KKF61_02475 [Patescibacteria group bacterium]|nr:hypothetical protein [Patescibacteria group bacterium]
MPYSILHGNSHLQKENKHIGRDQKKKQLSQNEIFHKHIQQQAISQIHYAKPLKGVFAKALIFLEQSNLYKDAINIAVLAYS